ncbi:hypothetical protein HC026_04020 [Lactobacillus sp. LC28-10]|uniref:HTH merR-type domain-containing protein n=1 Tax=Secundilactobacillus angelensis TaxID=2722706 RepID=A0ABX1KVZ3_9LACO|nr:hypothetical protein [Secundilactobacillus angelensis]MCH5462429.1 hypothetical protein [Secundilactobacillus angelensis]NLR18089.1 hypothetical protein [Secundilactobacillus angelensis]
MIEGQQLSAGQFAQLMRIDRHVLNRFDELGLFEPAVRDKNGRRSYDLNQVNQWLSLQATVKLENDLNQTKATLKNNENDHVAMLKYQQQLIEEQLNQLGVAHQQIAQEISNQETARQAMPEAATVVNQPPVDLLTTTLPEEMAVNGAQIQQQVAHVLSVMAIPPVHLLVGKVHSHHAVEMGNSELVTALYTPLAPNSHVKADTSQTGGRVVIAYHHLDQPLMVGFDRLRKFADEHDLVLGGDFYEEPIISSWQTSEPHDQVVRLSVEVKE